MPLDPQNTAQIRDPTCAYVTFVPGASLEPTAVEHGGSDRRVP